MTTEPNEDGGIARLTRSLDLMWGRTERDRPPRGPKPALTLDRIVKVAIRLANRDGLAALSMRSLATELGVGTMSLYRYVPGKGELIDLMVDHAFGPASALPQNTDRTDWRHMLEQIAEGSWTLYTTNPWLIQVNRARPILGPNSMDSFEQALTALSGLGLTGQEKVSILVAIDNLVLGAARGYVLYQQAAQQSGFSDEAFWRTQEPYMVRALEDGVYPHIAALPEDSFSREAADTMRFGLSALLDGFATLITTRQTP
ncbi:TetR/AcrR family transcriptional regulator [Streptomyces iconiensis]|uniref:TetR/AcrR family transcriptional regulator n=1 Tax=Streptomyces iconiensis TaxID=1384038 RepID=A0ABT7AAX4_9ACTN|nr:TetR/AcrR family transcriptional regulator [Streptomyces iconiensis]MDJ1138479.1 TetR/AcrR family transcriptional regulator [Streptomyces iconiensis]